MLSTEWTRSTYAYEALDRHGNVSILELIQIQDPQLSAFISGYSFQAFVASLCQHRRDVYGRLFQNPSAPTTTFHPSMTMPVLHWACYLSLNVDYLEIIYNLWDVNLEIDNYSRETAIIYACSLGRTKSVYYLLEKGARANEHTVDRYGRMLSTIAYEKNFFDIYEILVNVSRFRDHARGNDLVFLISQVKEGFHVAPFKQWFDRFLCSEDKNTFEFWINHHIFAEVRLYYSLFSPTSEKKKDLIQKLKSNDLISFKIISYLVFPKASTRFTIRYLYEHVKQYRAWHFIND